MRTPIFEGVDSTHGFKHRGEMFFDKSESQIYICDPAIPPVPPTPPTPVMPTKNVNVNCYLRNSCVVFIITEEDSRYTSTDYTLWDIVDCDAVIISGQEYVDLRSAYLGPWSSIGTKSTSRTWFVTYKTLNGKTVGNSQNTFTVRFTKDGGFIRDVTLPVQIHVNTEKYTFLDLSPFDNIATSVAYTAYRLPIKPNQYGTEILDPYSLSSSELGGSLLMFSSSDEITTENMNNLEKTFTGIVSIEYTIPRTALDATVLVEGLGLLIPTSGAWNDNGEYSDLSGGDISIFSARAYTTDWASVTLNQFVASNHIGIPYQNNYGRIICAMPAPGAANNHFYAHAIINGLPYRVWNVVFNLTD